MRGKTSGHTIEKIYPFSFVNFDHVYLLDVYKVARAKLYYIREKIGKDAKMKSLITAEQRGIDLLVVAKENLAAELPAIINEIIDETPIDEQTADAIIEEQTMESPEGESTSSEESVVEEAAVEEATVEEAAVEEAAVEETPIAEAVPEETLTKEEETV